MKIVRFIQNISPLLFILYTSESVFGQSIQHELKKDLWKTIKPYSSKGDNPTNPTVRAPQALDDYNKLPDVMEYYYKTKSKMTLDDFYDEYKRTHTVNPNVYTFYGDEPINKVKAGYLTPELFGGHFQMVPAKSNYIKPSGLNLSGGGRKKLSEKTKKILKEVFGQEPEE
ncbi:MAG: hypothetical protein QM654_12265 [Dysgonamonadaceae bacterium]